MVHDVLEVREIRLVAPDGTCSGSIQALDGHRTVISLGDPEKEGGITIGVGADGTCAISLSAPRDCGQLTLSVNGKDGTAMIAMIDAEERLRFAVCANEREANVKVFDNQQVRLAADIPGVGNPEVTVVGPDLAPRRVL